MAFSMNRRAALLTGAALIGAAACKGGGASAEPLATTTAGPVRGTVEEGVYVFKGVRYGATTEGRRFLPPQPPQPWTEAAETIEYANSSPQGPAGDGGGLYKSWRNTRPLSEDCLFLNVWTKGLDAEGARPVMVWFHGGGFTTGSGSSFVYDGVRLANKGDVVVVTVNHRLNAFGYTYLGEVGGEAFADSGNVGNLDMVLSLEWVRDNIAAFGGDPANALIMGESGGGSKVSCLMATPPAAGLFHRAVVQSGSTLAVRTPDVATANARRLMEACGVTTAEELQAVPMQTIIDKMGETQGLSFGPVVDGRSLPRQPFTPDAPEISRNVPMLIGTTKDEQTALQAGRRPELFDLTWETLPNELESYRARMDVDAAIAKTRELYPDANAGEVYFVIATETGMRRNAIIQAERKAAQGGAPAYMYLLTYESAIDGGKWGSPHAFDIAMMFDNVAKSESFVGDDVEGAQKVADAMSTAWINFARDGNPGWDAYTPANRATMVFDTTSQVVVDPRKEEREMYADIRPAPPAS